LASRSTVALIGSETLLGREIRDIVSTSGSPLDLRLIAEQEEEAGRLTRVGGEAALVTGLKAVNLADADAIFLAGSPESSRKALKIAVDTVPLIDLTGVLEDQPQARLRAPMVEAAPPAIAGSIQIIAHAASIALALFLRRLQSYTPVRRSVIQILAPASEQGAAGIEELQNQSISLLSFKPLTKAVFDAQLGFNVLARYGDEAPAALEQSELRIERHLASLLALPGPGKGVPMPSLRLIQAPVFHGYSVSAWVELEGPTPAEALESALVVGGIEVRGGEFEPPTIIGQAGQNGITVGAIGADRNHPQACWFWMTIDNLRLVAENAVAAVSGL
jgi:aspartate-semialdehyde dehydrogenase